MKDLFDLTGRVALVTGASSGLGVQFAKALARQGADVAICARRVEKLEQVKKEVEALGVRCYAHACDVLKTDDIKQTMKDVAVYFCAREAAKYMISRGYGKIINIGSIHSEVVMSPATWPVTAYATAKGGVKMLTKGLASEWASKGITVNAIGPAYFGSEMTNTILDSGAFDAVAKAYCPMGRPGKEGELDGALIYFASDASSYTTGQLLCVDGGWTTI